MPASINLAATKINADTAGATTTPAERNVTTTQAAPLADLFHGEINLGGLFAGGAHPESLPVVADTSHAHATDSVQGRLGGLIPRPAGVVSPGPSVAGAQAVLADATRRGTDVVSRVRKALGI